MKRPSYQHYPGDWRANAKLRRCSWAARGVWVEVLGLMHDSDEYGILRWPLREIADAVGCPLKLVRELAEKGVMKGDDKSLETPYVYAPSSGGRRGPEVTLIPKQAGPIWFSSRMVRDEHVRQTRGASTRFKPGGNNGGSDDEPDTVPAAGLSAKSQPSRTPTARQGYGSSASASASSSELQNRAFGVSQPFTPQPPGNVTGNGAVGQSELRERRQRAEGMRWHDMRWVADTAATVETPRRTNEPEEDWKDRVFMAIESRMRQAAADWNRRRANR